jgi:lysophospholipase-like protein
MVRFLFTIAICNCVTLVTGHDNQQPLGYELTQESPPLPTITQVVVSTHTKHTRKRTTKTRRTTDVPDGIICQDDIPTGTFDYCATSTITTVTPPFSPTTPGYTVSSEYCTPNSPLARLATGVNSAEASWVATRASYASAAMNTYLARAWVGLNQYNLDLKNNLPRVGVALSGGGFRAMLNGAGVLQAFTSDGNPPTARTGGILDSSLYVTGLSGGAWLLGSWALNGFPHIDTLVRNWSPPLDGSVSKMLT